MVTLRRFLSMALLLAGSVQAALADRLVLDTDFSEDSDGLRQHSLYAGAVHALPTLDATASVGLRAGHWRLEGPGDAMEFGALRLDHERALGPVALSLRALQLFNDGWSPTLGNAGATWTVGPRLSLSAGVDAELVDTVIAARRHTRFESWNVSGEVQALPALTVVGGLLLQDFSDGNQREGGLLRVIYSPAALEGFNAQLRLRRRDSELRGIGYFSPDRFEEGMVLLQYGHAVAGERFMLTGQVGGGQQRVDGRDSMAAYLAELRTRGWFNDSVGLEGKLGCSNSGDINVRPAADSYRYCYATLSLLHAW